MPSAQEPSTFDFKQFNRRHLDLEVTEINLVVYFDHQGYCDERADLAKPRAKRGIISEPKPESANHFALWFAVDSDEPAMVAIDITQINYASLPNPYKFEGAITEGSSGQVRVASKSPDFRDDVGSLMREIHNIRPGTTIRTVLDRIYFRGLNLYRFTPTYKQHSGCRFWILSLAEVLEMEGIVGEGFADDVECFLMVHYRRLTEKVRGKLKTLNQWGPGLENIQCAEIVVGEFSEPTSSSPSKCC